MGLEKLQTVGVEVNSYCNRACWFCPNSFLDRRSSQNHMQMDLFIKILDELRVIGFNKEFSFSYFNEPLSSPLIFSYIEKAREYLPEANIRVSTNGDYLNNKMLRELRDAGLSLIRIQHYLADNEIFNKKNALVAMQRKARKLELEEIEIVKYRNDLVKLETQSVCGIVVEFLARDFRINGNTRGDSLQTIESVSRKGSCILPQEQVSIDYTGNLLPCCNFREDYPPHRKFVMGNVRDESLANIFYSRKYTQFREITKLSPLKFSPCASCSMNDNQVGEYE